MIRFLPFEQNRLRAELAGSLLLAMAAVGCADAEQAPASSDPGSQPVAAEAEPAAQTAPAARPECDDVYELRSHGATPDSPYMVPAGGEIHPQVRIDPPWGSTKVQAIHWQPISDNKKVLHHWILNAGMVGGMLAGWAPGDDEEAPYPPDVGMDLPNGPMRLDMHYFNKTGKQAEPDRSGVEVCVVKGAHLRKNSAAIAMGLTVFGPVLAPAKTKGHQATSSCTVRATQPVYLLSASPHAHQYARHMKFTLKKKSGQLIVMHDMPFQFGEQGSYELNPPLQVETGDVITTTCVYDNDTARNITFGESTENEMCFNFAIYYPKGAFSCGGFGGR